MKKLFLLIAVFMAVSLNLRAQTDVTATYLTNADFETTPTGVPADNTIYDVAGWTETPVAGALLYNKIGTIAYGAVTSPLGTAPTNGSSVTTGNTSLLGIKVHWGPTTIYVSQTVTLPAGKYTLTWDSHLKQVVTSQTSMCGYVIDGVTTYDALPTAVNTWKNHSLTITLAVEKSVTFRMGYNKTANVGGATSPILFVDNVKLTLLPVDKTVLQGLITSATAMNASPQPVGVSTAYFDLSIATATAQGVYDNASATGAEVIAQEVALTAAIAAVNSAITIQARIVAWTSLPYDATSVIVNPSFEINGAAGWSNPNGFWSQTNTSFPFKAGGVYFEKWKSTGNWTGLKISQKLVDLPNGDYKLIAAALNQPDNTGGAFIFANAVEATVLNSNDYKLKVTVTNNQLEVGYRVDNGGNYVATDNYRLIFLSGASPYIYLEPTTLTFDPTNLVKTFEITGGYLTGDAVLVPPTGISLDKTTLTPAEVAAGVIVTATFDNATVITNGAITITSGALVKSITVNSSIDPVILVSKTSMKFDELLATGSFTVTGSNLASDISIVAPAGITVDPVSIPKGTGAVMDVLVNVTYDGVTPVVAGNIVVSSGVAVKNIAVGASLNSACFTPLYTTLPNIITDPYCNSLASYAGWGTRTLVSDYVYCGANSIKVTGKCGGSLDYNLTGKISGSKTYRVKAMVSTNGTGEIKIGISGAADANVTQTISTAAGEWLPLDFTFTTKATPTSPNMYLNSCESQTATEGFIDNWEMYELPTLTATTTEAANEVLFSSMGQMVDVTVVGNGFTNGFTVSNSNPTSFELSTTTLPSTGGTVTVKFIGIASATDNLVIASTNPATPAPGMNRIGAAGTSITIPMRTTIVWTDINNLKLNDMIAYLVDGKIVTSFNLAKQMDVNFNVYSANGVQLVNNKSTFTAGNNQFTIDSNLPSGVYIVKVNFEGKSITSKIVK